MTTQTPEIRAGVQANGICGLANNLVKQHREFKATGIPAQADFPAVTAEQYVTALGTANLAILDAIAAANP